MNNIKKYRGKLGLSQKELAEAVGLARSYIGILESNHCTRISYSVAEMLAKFFGCNVFDVCGDLIFVYPPQTDNERTTIIRQLAKNLNDTELKEKILELVK